MGLFEGDLYTKRIELKVSEKQYKQIKATAKERGITIANLIRTSLDFEMNEKNNR